MSERASVCVIYVYVCEYMCMYVCACLCASTWVYVSRIHQTSS